MAVRAPTSSWLTFSLTLIPVGPNVFHSEFAQDMRFLHYAGTDPANFQLAVARIIKFLQGCTNVNSIPANELIHVDWFYRQLQCMPWSDTM